jgi:membrane protein DedA with SNARE-associated domain
MLDNVITFLQNADPAAVYTFLFLTAFLENVIPPIPGDIPVAFAGYLIYYSDLSFFWVLLWTSLGSTAGFMTVYLLSRYLGLKLYASGETHVRHGLARSIHKLFPPSEMEVVRQKFAAHGYAAVLANRFFFGSRAVISVVAGLLHLNVLFVLLASITSATVWNILLLYGGYLLGRNWQGIGSYVALYSIPVTIIFLGIMVFSVMRFIRQRKKGKD